jgi:glycosyltransferase involved in cell wall biosynthesis
VVSTSCPTGPKDLLEEGKFGRLVDVGDVESMAENIVLALENDGKDTDRQSHFMKKFDEKSIADQYLDILFET